MGQQLVERNFGHSAQKDGNKGFKDDDTIYRFLEDDESRALNGDVRTQCEPRPGIVSSFMQNQQRQQNKQKKLNTKQEKIKSKIAGWQFLAMPLFNFVIGGWIFL